MKYTCTKLHVYEYFQKIKSKQIKIVVQQILNLTMYVSDNGGSQSMSWECHQYFCRTLPPYCIMGWAPAGDGTKQQTKVVFPRQFLRRRCVLA